MYLLRACATIALVCIAAPGTQAQDDSSSSYDSSSSSSSYTPSYDSGSSSTYSSDSSSSPSYESSSGGGYSSAPSYDSSSSSGESSSGYDPSSPTPDYGAAEPTPYDTSPNLEVAPSYPAAPESGEGYAETPGSIYGGPYQDSTNYLDLAPPPGLETYGGQYLDPGTDSIWQDYSGVYKYDYQTNTWQGPYPHPQ
jgi:hypothetical protein